MLKKLVIKNVNSINICEIDFLKGNYKFAEENVFKEVVNPIAIYGHNGSGKSSVMNAIESFIALLNFPAKDLIPFTVNNVLFKKYVESKIKDEKNICGSIQCNFSIGSDDYEYYLETSSKLMITNEYLKKNGDIYFGREGNKYKYKRTIEKLSTYSPLVPFLRVLAGNNIDDSTIQSVYEYLSSFTHVNMPFINRGNFATSKLFNNVNVNDLLVEKSEETKALLKTYKHFPIYSIVKNENGMVNGEINYPYEVILEAEGFKETLPLGMMSVGMQNHSVLLSILLSMKEDGVIFIDEVDAALHPATIEAFLKVIQEKHIQVVFTLHNTYAMQLMRPDQIYFAKWSKGFSNYYRLSKVYPNIREVNNIEKMYLSCTFDGAMIEDE